MDVEKLTKGMALMQEALATLSGGPFSYTLKCLVAAREALLTKYAPFKVGDRVELAATPEISEEVRPGWISAEHFLVKGSQGVVRVSDVMSDGRLVFYVEFLDETWKDAQGVFREPLRRRHYCFDAEALVHCV